jgi:two-component system, chemotaxis family, chemotaxis protein CheY
VPTQALIIDDSRAMRSILRRQLTQLGFEVFEACDGREGMSELRRHAGARLALVDWNMPEMNGHEFVKAVRAERQFDAVCLVMVTSEVATPIMALALSAGADDFFMKPFSGEMLREKLQQLGFAEVA